MTNLKPAVKKHPSTGLGRTDLFSVSLKFWGVLDNFGVSPVGPEVLLYSPCGKQIKQSKMLNLRGI